MFYVPISISMIAKSEIKLLFIIIIIIKDGGRQYNRHHVAKTTLHRAILFRFWIAWWIAI